MGTHPSNLISNLTMMMETQKQKQDQRFTVNGGLTPTF